jgi:hypothetical protein
MRALIVAALVALFVAPAVAQEPVGCDKFKWPLDREKALLASPAAVALGGEVAPPLDKAVKLSVVPLDDAKLPMAPTRKPKPDTYAGCVRFSAPPMAGTYRVTLTEPAWIDVVQDGAAIKSGAFSGALGCEGVRKSVKFDLSAGPFVIEISGTPAHEISIVVTPD